ncbi:MAG: beta-N-acetylglucosaminidase domain-containing protein [Caulobacteraceae bacterium]
MTVDLGVIEGYYGLSWTWAARRDTAAFLSRHGYRFFIYAPKADPFLRKRWREEHPVETAEAIAAFSADCRGRAVRFGVGLSPFEIYRSFDAGVKADLGRKLATLDAIGLDDLAILFDDMRGDIDGLARIQTDIVHWIAGRTKATRVIVCPTYYSDDPVLDRVFGARPPRFLEEFGAALDRKIEVFWTGEEVCSREFGAAHLERVAGQLRRKPLFWDNYPVNDGPAMSPYLHLRAFTGRPARVGGLLAGHAINPALQPILTRIPALTLAASYREGDRYAYGAAFVEAAEAVLGPRLAAMVGRHITLFQDTGLERMGEAVGRLRDRYAGIDHDGAQEIVDWLDGKWRTTSTTMADA